MIKKILLSTIIAFTLFSFNSKAQSEYNIQIGLKDSLQSQVLNESREFYVELPESYVPGSEQRYPVVYLLDGDA